MAWADQTGALDTARHLALASLSQVFPALVGSVYQAALREYFAGLPGRLARLAKPVLWAARSWDKTASFQEAIRHTLDKVSP